MRNKNFESILIRFIFSISIIGATIVIYLKLKAWDGTPFLILPGAAIFIILLINLVKNATGYNCDMNLPLILEHEKEDI